MASHPQDLIDAVRDGMHARDWQHYVDGDAIAVLDIVRAYDTARPATAPDMPDWVTHVEIEFQGPDPTWPNGTRWQEGMGTTVEEAIADASKDGGQ